MVDKTLYSIFKGGSKTYFYSTIFFPERAKEDVFKLYSFVRKADDLVDSIPQQTEEFYEFKDRYHEAQKGDITGDIVIDSFVEVSRRKNFESKWADAFLESMEMDITRSTYNNLDELKVYLHGSSEVIGLFMARILDLHEYSFTAARHLGRAMQFINFIRDISEDLLLGRIYFSQEDLEEFRLPSLELKDTKARPDQFKGFIQKQLDTYFDWQKKAEEGFPYIPKRYLIPIKTASDMYNWTGRTISKDPFIVYKKKIKPSVPRIVSTIAYNSILLRESDQIKDLRLTINYLSE
ncbi:MAG TPA: phytoene/squalene synthase family protein [Methanofastidiosum sp.]|nr:phytoene/squalene synthase family protein [Methanofastidiosum sp.]HNU62504.1 phytoene/squalene synthase family protein [Methanofastidiosum sp.]HOI76004.1 phytoene/squalene synthase family protein [Methanofastidiosum sp.]